MATSETTHKFLKFEEGWPLVQEGIKKAVEIAEGVRSDRFTAEESMRLALHVSSFNLLSHLGFSKFVCLIIQDR